MNFQRLLVCDDTWATLEEDWSNQCDKVGEPFCDYATASVGAIRQLAENSETDQWALALKSTDRILAIAMGIRTRQKGFIGKVLRIREVTACPLLDYGILGEEEYVDTLIGMLNA